VDTIVMADAGMVYCLPWLDVADIIVCGHDRLPCPVAEWISRIMATYPGAALAAVDFSGAASVWGLRDGRLLSVDVGVRPFAAFLHTWLATGRPVDALEGHCSRRLRVRTGRWN
jgi:hypothetical protein